MGLSAGQARLLSITARLTDNEYRSQRLTNARLNLSSISEEARVEYQKALDAQKFVYMAYNNAGNPEKTDLTPTVLYQYQPMKNQYALVNNTGQLLVTSEDAKNFESSANLGEFLNCYGLLQGDVDQLDKIMNMEAYETDMEKYQAYLDRLDTYNAQNPELDIERLFRDALQIRAQNVMGLQVANDDAFDKSSGNLIPSSITSFTYLDMTPDKIDETGVAKIYKTALKSEPYAFEKILNYLCGNFDSTSGLTAKEEEAFTIISQNLANRYCDGKETYVTDDFKVYKYRYNNNSSDRTDTNNYITVSDLVSQGFNKDNLVISQESMEQDMFWSYIIATKGNDYSPYMHYYEDSDDGRHNLFNKIVKDDYYERDVNGNYIYYTDSNGEENRKIRQDAQGYLLDENYKRVVKKDKDGCPTESSGTYYNQDGTICTSVNYWKASELNYPDYKEKRESLLGGLSISQYVETKMTAEEREKYLAYKQNCSDYNSDGSVKTLLEKIQGMQSIYDTLYSHDPGNGKDKTISMEIWDAICGSFRNMIVGLIEGDVGNLLPKPTYVEEPHKPQVYTEDKEKCQWYINLWYRMNGSQDSKELMKIKNDSVNEFNEEVQINQYVLELDGTVKNTFTSNYKVIPKEIATSKDWLNNVLSQGIVSMEKVGVTRTTDDGTLKWSSIIYSNATDIIREEDSNAIAHAEAKYTATVNEVEIKDKKYQMELRNLDTEHNALQTEYNSVKSAVDENIKRSFKVFQG